MCYVTRDNRGFVAEQSTRCYEAVELRIRVGTWYVH